MDITIDLSQVIAMNTMIADYAVLPSSLLYDDHCFVMYLNSSVPVYVVEDIRKYCAIQNLFCTVETLHMTLYDDSVHTIVRITTWPKSHREMIA